jgi:hypothetical protein
MAFYVRCVEADQLIPLETDSMIDDRPEFSMPIVWKIQMKKLKMARHSYERAKEASPFQNIRDQR